MTGHIKTNNGREEMKKAKVEAVVIDKLTGDIVSRHKEYRDADIKASKMGERYAVKIAITPESSNK